jgi:hypothetical protein
MVVRMIRAMTAILNKSYGSSDSDLSLPPAWINKRLTAMFAGELPNLKSAMGQDRPAYRRGVSIISVLRKNVTP